jgi:hypothetical protein
LIIYDTIQAVAIESDDQVLIEGDPVEVWSAVPADNDPTLIMVEGLSNNSGDKVQYVLNDTDMVELWGV